MVCWKAIRMKYLLLAIGIIFAFQRTSAGGSSSATNLLCNAKNITSDLNSDPCAYARIKEIQEQGISDKDEEEISCVLKDGNGTKIGSALLEIDVNEDPPTTLLLHVGNFFLSKLQSRILECSYGDIGPNNRISGFRVNELEPIGEDWSYQCDDAEHKLTILFTGVHREKPAMSKNRKKRSLFKDSPEACVTFSKKDSRYYYLKEDEGCPCNTTNQKRGKLMYNEASVFSCFLCCKQHHWSKREKQCKKCPEGTTQEDVNVWTTCDYIEYVDFSKSSTFAPELGTVTSTSPSSASKGPDATESPSTSTEAQSPVEEIKQPVYAPTKLFLLEVSTSYAYIEWEKIPSTPSRPVTEYWISLVKLKPKLEKFGTECNVTCYNFTSLKPDSIYQVRIQGMNSAGKGPFSSGLRVHTLFELPLVEITDVRVIEGLAHVTWKPKSPYLQLRVVAVPTSPKGEKLSTVTKHDAVRKLTFPLSEKGTYEVRFYYVDHYTRRPREGPMSDRYSVESTGMSVIHIILAIFAVGLVLVPIALFIVDHLHR